MTAENTGAVTATSGTLVQAIQDGIAWTMDHLDRDQGQQVVLGRLKELRRRGRRLARAAAMRPAIGVFGASQSGKSYLVSNMIRIQDSQPLEVLLPGGVRRDFERDLNPPGGQESTGAVTRFSVKDVRPSGQEGIQLELLNHAEVVAILAHGYQANVLVDSTVKPVDREALQATFSRLRGRMQAVGCDGLDEDDIFDLRDYMDRNFPSEVRVIDLKRLGFWEDLAEVAPRVAAEERWELFHFLWEQSPAITGVFRKLTGGLRQLGFARHAATSADALVPKLAEDSQPRTLLDVRVVIGLAQAAEALPPVALVSQSGQRTSLPRSVITALVKEIILPIPPETTEEPHLRFLETADILDFPGARPAQTINPGKLQPTHADFVVSMKEIFVRGKVAFLFESYDHEFRINTLIIAQNDGNMNVKELPILAYNWIARNIGASPEARSDQVNRFFLAFTFWNNELAKPAGSITEHGAKWQARIAKNLVEEWQHAQADDKWLSDWVARRSFNGCFFVRDPRYSKSTHESKNGVEIGIRPEFEAEFRQMRESFITSPIIAQHVADPVRMWDETTQPNRTGCHYLLVELGRSMSADRKDDQIHRHLAMLRQDVIAALAAMHHSEDSVREREKAERNGRIIGGALWQLLQKNTLGLLLEHLYLPEDVAWTVYYGIENPALGTMLEDGGGDDAGSGGLAGINATDFFDWATDIAPAPTQAKPTKARQIIWKKADAFADDLMDRWYTLLGGLPENPSVPRRLSLPVDEARVLVGGIKDAARRIGLRNRIRDAVKEGLDGANSHLWIDMYARVAAQIVNDFVNDMDWRRVPEEQRPIVTLPRIGRKVAIFSQWNSETPGIAGLTLQEEAHGIVFPVFWIQGLYSAIVANAEEISFDVEANRRLSGILKQLGHAS
jgi:hypothetical protein